MKRTLLVALGLAVCVNTAPAAGHIYFNNYFLAPYNQVFWSPSTPVLGNQAVNDPAVQLELWYAKGSTGNPNQLSFVASFSIAPYGGDPGLGHGGGGFYEYYLTLPAWQFGETYTFQIRAGGNSLIGPVTGASILWTERDAITPLPSPPGVARSIGFSIMLIPEPSVLSLVAGGVCTMIARNRKLRQTISQSDSR
jgi:hypothetical protein